MLLQQHMDTGAVIQLWMSLYFFLEAYEMNDLYWMVQITEGFAYIMPVLAYFYMLRNDTYMTREGYYNMRQISTQLLTLTGGASAFVDYLYWDAFPAWGIIGMIMAFSLNRELTWFAHQWVDEFKGKNTHDFDHIYDDEDEEDYEVEEFFSSKIMNMLFKAADNTVRYQNNLTNALRF